MPGVSAVVTMLQLPGRREHAPCLERTEDVEELEALEQENADSVGGAGHSRL